MSQRLFGNLNQRNKGFTLIEVIAVLAIMGIVAAVVVSRMTGTHEYSLAAEADTLKGHLRYAQYRAMSDDALWKVSITSSAYTLQRDMKAICNLPNENSGTHTLPTGVSLSGSSVNFDDWGSPVDASGTPNATNLTLTLSSGGESRTITITRNTGFIP